MADRIQFVKIGSSYFNPAAVAIVTPDQADHLHGIEFRPAEPERFCLILTVGGDKVRIDESADLVVAALQSLKSPHG